MRPLALLLFTSAVWAMGAPHYDLDSLIWQSRYIVEVEYVGEKRARVVQSFLGDIEPGTIRFCSLMRAFAWGWEPLALGENPRMFLFLDKNKRLVCSGKWLVHDGGVHRPTLGNPGGYAWSPTDRGPRVADFRKALPDRIRAAHAMQERLDRVPVADAVPGLVALLRKRGGLHAHPHDRDLRRYDLVALAICRHLATLRDNGALAAALQLPLGSRSRTTIARGFATAEGRNFLLARIGNPKVGYAVRTKLALALEEAGPLVWEGRWVRTGKDSGYFSRIAALARATHDQEKLCATLCHQLSSLIRDGKRELPADVAGAVSHLVMLYRVSRFESVLYEIARALNGVGKTAYDRLHSRAGPVISIVRRVSKANRASEVHVEYDYEGMRAYNKSVFVFQRGEREIEVPVKLDLTPDTLGSLSRPIPLPKELKPGRYRVFLRLYLKDGGRSDSYGVTTDLPFR